MTQTKKGLVQGNANTGDYPMTVTKRTVGGKEYIVKSVFIGTQSIETAILKLAERKAIREMGLE